MSDTVQKPINGFTVPTATDTGTRLVPALIDGIRVHIECPDWCVVDHVLANEQHLVDVFHFGQLHVLTFPVPMLAPISVRIAQWPNIDDEDGGLPILAVDTDNDVNTYKRPAALALADQLVAFAADVRNMAKALPDDVPAARSQADEALRRIQGGNA